MNNEISESKAIIECVKDYFKDCPYLNELSEINVDYLNIESNDKEYWSLEPLDVPIIIQTNVLGTKTERQCQFILASRSFFNPSDDTQNIKNLLLFEKIAEWIYQNSKNHILPTLNDDEESKSMEVMNPGYLYGTSNDKRVARYQMRCKLIYEKKEEKYKLWH